MLKVRNPDLSKRRKRPVPVQFRVANLCRLFRDRYGADLPNDDAGLEDATIIACHLARLPGADPVTRITNWLSLWCPWMPIATRIEFIDNMIDNPRTWTADALAHALNVNAADRRRLRLWTIGATDQTAAEREAARKQRDKERKEARRRARGAKPRAQCESQGKPWIAAGIARSTLVQAPAPSRVDNPSALKSSNTADELSHSRSDPSKQLAPCSKSPPAVHQHMANNLTPTAVNQSEPKRMQIRRKLKAALDGMIWNGLPFDEAARAAGFNVRAMRKALERPSRTKLPADAKTSVPRKRIERQHLPRA
jgi:hypothetical protein